MATLGGKREGAGRKKGFKALQREKDLEYIAQRLSKELPPIVDKQIEQAKAGDNNARTDLYNRAYGRPKETMDMNIVDFTFDETT